MKIVGVTKSVLFVKVSVTGNVTVTVPEVVTVTVLLVVSEVNVKESVSVVGKTEVGFTTYTVLTDTVSDVKLGINVV